MSGGMIECVRRYDGVSGGKIASGGMIECVRGYYSVCQGV